MISFKMQYPKLLFKKEQKDYTNELFKVDNTEYLINTANPFNILHIGHRIRKEKPDAVIIQWWHPYFAPCYKLLRWAVGPDIKIIATCHNVFPHERFPMDKQLSRLALKRLDGYIVQSQSDAQDLLKIKDNPKYILTAHPTYNVFKINDMPKEQARLELDISMDQKVLLFFGFVREYKGLKYLIKAMPQICEQLGDVKLMVVGSFGDDKEEYLALINESGVSDAVMVKDSYTPDNEVEKYFAACDLVVCPYVSATQSGIVQIAYGFEKPVIATNVGGLPDVVTDERTGFIVKSEAPDEIAGAIIRYYEENRETEFLKNIKEESYKFSWEHMVECIETLMD